jgi:hypothetical protein
MQYKVLNKIQIIDNQSMNLLIIFRLILFRQNNVSKKIKASRYMAEFYRYKHLWRLTSGKKVYFKGEIY